MKYILYILVLPVFCIQLSAQSQTEHISGKVTFITSQNVYVKFTSTEGISAGDTLFILSANKLTPVLKVNNLSSVSCVCTSISSTNLSVSQDIIARKKITVQPEIIKAEQNVTETVPKVVPVDTVKKAPVPEGLKQSVNGSISIYSYSDFSNTAGKNSNQLRYTYTLNARNLGNSKFSLENYITFRHKLGDWAAVQSDVFNALKIYTFAVGYEPDKTTKITLGRTINYRISSIGAMDGLQAEKTFNNFSAGVVAGFRPDYKDYGFNSKLLQYGGYVAYDTRSEGLFSQSSLAFMEQMNSSKTDRRFLYFQHSNSLIKNVYFFSTFEVDLYKVKNNLPQNTFDLTSLYLSLRLRMTDNFSLTASYDQRKNVLFYETYKSLIDSVYQNERRQSLRLQANYRITKNLTLGVESGYRFLKSDPHPSRNANVYLSYSQISSLNMTVTINGTYLESSFMNGKILGADISKDLAGGKLQASLGYRYVDYTLPENILSVVQHIGEIGLYWQLSPKMFFSANYEGTFEKHDKYNRVYLQLRKRF